MPRPDGARGPAPARVRRCPQGRGMAMRRFFKFVMARWLARTPIGLAVLALGWFLGRRRRRRVQQEGQRSRPVRRRSRRR
ncbi:hypothetical protein GCM10018965_098510 [Nonomuraea roseola]